MVDHVLPTALAVNNSRANVPKIIIANSGGLRFDVYAGQFTKNDQLTASPFNDAFQYIPAVSLGIAKAVLPKLNGEGTSSKRDLSSRADAAGLNGRGEVEELYGRWVAKMHSRAGPERRAAKNLTLGYVTQDACPDLGDDILHTPVPFFGSPDYISSAPPTGSDDLAIDLVFVDFIGSLVLGVLNGLQTAKNYTTADVLPYTGTLLNEVLGVFAMAEWN